MKARSDIERRLRRLRERYLHAHLRRHFERRPSACAHNHEQVVPKLPYRAGDVETELDLAPRRVTTLIVLGGAPAVPVRLCMLGSDDPSTWDGDVCDTVDRAKACPYFKPKVTMEEARASFDALMADDKYVLQNFPDVAALQWALGLRVFRLRPTLWERFRAWRLARRLKSLPPPPPEPELPQDFWT